MFLIINCDFLERTVSAIKKAPELISEGLIINRSNVIYFTNFD